MRVHEYIPKTANIITPIIWKDIPVKLEKEGADLKNSIAKQAS